MFPFLLFNNSDAVCPAAYEVLCDPARVRVSRTLLSGSLSEVADNTHNTDCVITSVTFHPLYILALKQDPLSFPRNPLSLFIRGQFTYLRDKSSPSGLDVNSFRCIIPAGEISLAFVPRYQGDGTRFPDLGR
jgi:hypothetical protein